METLRPREWVQETRQYQRLAHGLGEEEIRTQENLANNEWVSSKTGITKARSAEKFNSTVFIGHLLSVQILDCGENQCKFNLVSMLLRAESNIIPISKRSNGKWITIFHKYMGKDGRRQVLERRQHLCLTLKKERIEIRRTLLQMEATFISTEIIIGTRAYGRIEKGAYENR